jgi:hypothetical protein
MGEAEGNVQGNQTGDVTGQQQQTLIFGNYRDQMPTDLKANPIFDPYKTIGDLGKSHIDVMGKIKELDGMTAKVGELEGRLSNSIPKLPDNPTKEQIEAHYNALGRPAKPEEYEFPKGEGVEHDEKMVNWFRQLAFGVGLTKNQAAAISQQWDQFLQGMVQAEEETVQNEIEERNKAFRGLFTSEEEHNATLEGVSRVWKRVVQTFSQSEEDFDLNKYMLREGIGKEPTFLKVLIHLSKLTGEDFSPKGSGGPGAERPGMIYDKTPQHQK